MNSPDRPPSSVWTRLIAKYQMPDRRRAVLQICNSFIPFVAAWVLMVWSLDLSYWLTLALAFPAAGLLVRIFIIQHDCGHGSFFESQRANDGLGFLCGILTFTPYQHWRLSHAIHHAGAANLEKRGIGDVYTYTVDEYRRLPRRKRWLYRIQRHPSVLFGVGAAFHFVVIQRLMFQKKLRKTWASLHWTNLTIAGVIAALVFAVGLKAFLLVEVPIIVIAASAGSWLFYVQHQYENTYWAHDGDWDYTRAALDGSSYYALPAVLRWFTGNIGYHHIHHLSPRVPNYRLQACHEANPELQQVTVLTLRSSLRSARLHLWDEEHHRLVGFDHLRTAA